MKMIVAVDDNWAIGLHNKLLVRIPSDHKNFREMTTGKAVVLGRKTLETFPAGQPLKNRTNIILSTDPALEVRGAVVVHSIEELLKETERFDGGDVFVIGGESVYRQLLPYCDTAYVTKIRHTYEADSYFPNLDELPDWEIAASGEEQTYFDLEYEFVRYERKKS